MKILFVHDNFPAQFGALGSYLSSKGWDVKFATAFEGAKDDDQRFLKYASHREPTEGVHPYAHNFEKCVIKGQGRRGRF